MVFFLPDYNMGYRVASLAKSKETMERLMNDGLNTIYLNDCVATLYPENLLLTRDPEILEKIHLCDEYDVFQITSSGKVFLYYSNQATDNSFFVTGKCNSNCIMCPSSDHSRKMGHMTSLPVLLELVKYIPSDAPHLTITGGEPFMMGEDIFSFFASLKGKFEYTEFLLLTNGRIFAIPEYCYLLKQTLPSKTIIGIPIHGHTPEVHDRITRVPGSFIQTVTGLRNLIALGFYVEIRIVISRVSAPYLEEIASYILSEMSGIYCVKFIGLEMLGNAAKNEAEVWIPYSEAFQRAKPAITKLVVGGIDVGLYNFPLCAVDKAFWPICAKSITDYKVKYVEQCELCSVKDACGGIFSGTYRLAKGSIHPLMGE